MAWLYKVVRDKDQIHSTVEISILVKLGAVFQRLIEKIILKREIFLKVHKNI